MKIKHVFISKPHKNKSYMPLFQKKHNDSQLPDIFISDDHEWTDTPLYKQIMDNLSII